MVVDRAMCSLLPYGTGIRVFLFYLLFLFFVLFVCLVVFTILSFYHTDIFP